MQLPSKKFWLFVSPLLMLIVIGLTYIASTTTYVIDGISMLPTYDNSDSVLGLKMYRQLNRRDIVTFSPPSDQCSQADKCVFVARVIGLPGEKLEMANYFVKINDQQIEEPYLTTGTKTLFSPKVGGIFQLKDDEYFLMGDNRPYAADSRLFGPIKKSDITAKIISKNKFKPL